MIFLTKGKIMTHEDLVAKKILDELPPDDARTLRQFAVRSGKSILEVIKVGLLHVSREINTGKALPLEQEGLPA